MSAYAFLAATRRDRRPGDRVTLVGRPHSPVAHLWVGPVTRSGRYAKGTGGTVCRARTRRLMVLEGAGSVLDRRGRRVCARCVQILGDDVFGCREDWEAGYAHLTVLDLVNANHLVRSTAESHRVGYLAGLLFPPPPVKHTRARLTPERLELRALHDRIEANRDFWRSRERSDEDREAAAAKRENETARNVQAVAQHRKDARIARQVDRRNQGVYEAPWERGLLDTA